MSERSERIIRRGAGGSCGHRAKRGGSMSERSERIIGRMSERSEVPA
ncbi:hypothetical protein [Micromonospora sp. NPDC093277]